MSVAELIALSTGGGAIAVLSLIEISPIKAKPVSWLFQKLGQAINRDIVEQQKEMRKDLLELSDELKEHKAIECRARILRFGDEVLHGQRHSQDHFEQILLDIKKYNRYCADHPDFENNVTEITSARIKEVYGRCLKQNDFL